MEKLTITSPSFKEGGLIPVRFTGFGEDISPELNLHGLCGEARSLAVILNDKDHPIVPFFNHWILWNVPAGCCIPENVAHGEIVSSLANAVQGIGYGKHRYKGPKPPFHWSHVYHFEVYALDCFLDLPSSSRKKEVLSAMKGHILQQGLLTGHYR